MDWVAIPAIVAAVSGVAGVTIAAYNTGKARRESKRRVLVSFRQERRMMTNGETVVDTLLLDASNAGRRPVTLVSAGLRSGEGEWILYGSTHSDITLAEGERCTRRFAVATVETAWRDHGEPLPARIVGCYLDSLRSQHVSEPWLLDSQAGTFAPVDKRHSAAVIG